MHFGSALLDRLERSFLKCCFQKSHLLSYLFTRIWLQHTIVLVKTTPNFREKRIILTIKQIYNKLESSKKVPHLDL